MILRDALRYYELTGSDFLSDMNKYSRYIQAFELEIIPDDFSEVIENFQNNLVSLALDQRFLTDSVKDIVKKYCHAIPKMQGNSKKATFELELTDNSLRQNKKEQSQVLDIVSTIIAADLELSAFLDMELELVIELLNLSGEKKKQQYKKSKKKGGI